MTGQSRLGLWTGFIVPTLLSNFEPLGGIAYPIKGWKDGHNLARRDVSIAAGEALHSAGKN